jgi:hypothetical protein
MSIRESDIKAWAKDPEVFVADALGYDNITQRQKDILHAVKMVAWSKINAGKARPITVEEAEYAAKNGVAVMRFEGADSDMLLAMVILWFLCCFPQVKIPCVVNTEGVIAGIVKLLQDSKMSGCVGVEADKVYMKTAREDWFATFKTPGGCLEETFQGYMGDYILPIVGGASDVSRKVFATLQHYRDNALCNFVLLIFNSEKNTDYVTYNAKDWVTLYE